MWSKRQALGIPKSLSKKKPIHYIIERNAVGGKKIVSHVKQNTQGEKIDSLKAQEPSRAPLSYKGEPYN